MTILSVVYRVCKGIDLNLCNYLTVFTQKVKSRTVQEDSVHVLATWRIQSGPLSYSNAPHKSNQKHTALGNVLQKSVTRTAPGRPRGPWWKLECLCWQDGGSGHKAEICTGAWKQSMLKTKEMIRAAQWEQKPSTAMARIWNLPLRRIAVLTSGKPVAEKLFWATSSTQPSPPIVLVYYSSNAHQEGPPCPEPRQLNSVGCSHSSRPLINLIYSMFGWNEN